MFNIVRCACAFAREEADKIIAQSEGRVARGQGVGEWHNQEALQHKEDIVKEAQVLAGRSAEGAGFGESQEVTLLDTMASEEEDCENPANNYKDPFAGSGASEDVAPPSPLWNLALSVAGTVVAAAIEPVFRAASPVLGLPNP